MFLSRPSLISALECGELEIKADEEIDFGPGSITLHASPCWYRIIAPPQIWLDDADKLPRLEAITAEDTGHFIVAGRHTALVYTREKIGLGLKHFGLISGTSDLARAGISVEFSWFVAPGFGASLPSALVLEVFNSNECPVHFPCGMRLAHLLIGEYDRKTDVAYKDQNVIYDANSDQTPASKFAQRHILGLNHRK